MSTDWLPEKDAELIELMGHWEEYLADTAKRTAYGWDATECAKVQAVMSLYITAVDEYSKDKSESKAAAKKRTKKAAKASMRLFAGDAVRGNIKMPPEERLYLGVRTRDGKPTDPVVPLSFPLCQIRIISSGTIEVIFVDSITKKKARPKGVRGAEFLSAIGTVQPEADRDFTISDFSNVSPILIKYDLSDRGKMLFFRARWETTNNLKGVWSPMYSTYLA
jgi:hypothetical protein